MVSRRSFKNRNSSSLKLFTTAVFTRSFVLTHDPNEKSPIPSTRLFPLRHPPSSSLLFARGILPSSSSPIPPPFFFLLRPRQRLSCPKWKEEKEVTRTGKEREGGRMPLRKRSGKRRKKKEGSTLPPIAACRRTSSIRAAG